MKMRIGTMVACVSILLFSTGQAMAKMTAKEKCVAEGGTWAAIGGDLSSWTCYKVVKGKLTPSLEIFDRWGNLKKK